MNRKEFQQWLEQFPEDTKILVAVQQSPDTWQAYGHVSFEPFKLDAYAMGAFSYSQTYKELEIGESY